MQSRLLFTLLIGLLTAGCSSKEKEVLFESVQGTGIIFENKVTDTDSLNIVNYRNFYNGGGVATGDINNDGWMDVFFTANQGPNKLFLNKGDWTFEDISDKAGFGPKQQYSTGVVMVDINADGWLDIFVCNAGSLRDPALRKNQLFINDQHLGFTEQAEQYGLAHSGYTTQVSFFDYDLDGDLDCFQIDNSPVEVSGLGYPRLRDLEARNWLVDEQFKGGGDHLYRNDNGKFVEVTRAAGIHGTLMSFGMGVSVGDINGDHYPDIFVANDFFERDYLYINQQDGTFKDELVDRMQHTSYASMGADIGDINNDGWPEIFTTDMLPADDYRLKTTLRFDNIDLYRLRSENDFYHQFLQNTLQFNTGGGYFKDIAHFSGVSASEWSWGALIFDADNDGWNDLYVCNGIFRDLTNQDFLDFDADEIRKQLIVTGKKDIHNLVDRIPSIAVPNKLFRNKGNLKFDDIGEEWGFDQNSFSNGAAYADLDNDGDLDLVVNNVNEPALVLRNGSEKREGHFIGFQLKGTGANPFAIGTKLTLYSGKERMIRELYPSRGFQSSVEYRLLFGLGDRQVDSLVIEWPDGKKETRTNLVLNQYHILSPASPLNRMAIQAVGYNFLIPEQAVIFPKHIENDFTDFYRERAIPVMLSKPGPVGAAADINRDGWEDLYIGGSTGNPGQLYLQQANGSFTPHPQSALLAFPDFEDGAALFFDGDMDGDPDLFIGAAGNTATPGSRELQHRYFVNDGKGNFTLSANSFPLNTDNISVAVANDVDGDGDLDLFVGARCVTGIYGYTPQSHLYLNDGGGRFSEVPEKNMNGLGQIGMVTDAVWVNLDNKPGNELVVVGEWMSPVIYQWKNGSMVRLNSELEQLTGWWQTVQAADLDGDGIQDLVLGNYGKNYYLRPSSTEPAKLWLNDYDDNGSVDKVISRSVKGVDKPVFMKHEMESELPLLKKQNLRNNVYASRSMTDLFSEEKVRSSRVRPVNSAASVVAWGNGKGNFTVTDLPDPAQFSSIAAVLITDLNKDQQPDLVISGNEFDFQPQLGRLDASEGTILINEGKRQWRVEKEGLGLKGMVREVVSIRRAGKEAYYLFLINQDAPQLFAKI